MDHNWIYDALTGENAPKHIWNENGICIRCGEDAEEWEAGCVEEIVATLRAENAELRARAERWQQTAEENSWPFEWEVATELKRQRDELAAILDAHAQHPGFPQPPAGSDPDEPVPGTG